MMVGQRTSTAVVASRNLRIIDLATTGWRPVEIQRELGADQVSLQVIYNVLLQARRLGLPVPAYSTGGRTGRPFREPSPIAPLTDIELSAIAGKTVATQTLLLANGGRPSGEIVELIGTTLNSVRVVLHNARSRGEYAPREIAHDGVREILRVSFDEVCANAVDAAARERRISAGELVARVVKIAVRDDLIDAILDDRKRTRAA